MRRSRSPVLGLSLLAAILSFPLAASAQCTPGVANMIDNYTVVLSNASINTGMPKNAVVTVFNPFNANPVVVQWIETQQANLRFACGVVLDQSDRNDCLMQLGPGETATFPIALPGAPTAVVGQAGVGQTDGGGGPLPIVSVEFIRVSLNTASGFNETQYYDHMEVVRDECR